ncbi:hypothetical protein PVK06_009489 [Gossypium arboreum]|uniref:Uncharacterized protein n=1 Tax=Gossypium arboreum TaxID=29729 RepID=A0ABR0QML8_GOSAR|nr:hypothetical protein PVK06_009489 [Gossypium arboreum]
MLARLYQELCRETKSDKISISYVGKRNRIKYQLVVACSCCSRGPTDNYHFYVLEWNHGPSYVELPNQLEDIRLLLDQRSKANMLYTESIDSVRDYRNARIESSDAPFRVEAANFVATTKHG